MPPGLHIYRQSILSHDHNTGGITTCPVYGALHRQKLNCISLPKLYGWWNPHGGSIGLPKLYGWWNPLRSMLSWDPGKPYNSHTCHQHFKCLGYYCIPWNYVCNGIQDCPFGDDERGCFQQNCTMLFKCKGSNVCLHYNEVCNNITDCHEGDDEIFCDLPRCPSMWEIYIILNFKWSNNFDFEAFILY